MKQLVKNLNYCFVVKWRCDKNPYNGPNNMLRGKRSNTNTSIPKWKAIDNKYPKTATSYLVQDFALLYVGIQPSRLD